MLGIRSYRRTPRPRPEPDPRVIRDRSSVDDNVVVEKARHPFCIVMDVGRAKDHTVIMVMSMNPATRPYKYVIHRIEPAPLGTPHLDTAKAAGQARRKLEQAGHQVFAAIDATGIGAGTAELVQIECPFTVKVEISGDRSVLPDKYDPWRLRVPKKELVDAIVNTMEQHGNLTLSRAIAQADQAEFLQELRGFSRLIAANKDGSAKIEYGNDTAVAEHDDMVNAAAIGIWSFEYLANMGMFGGAGDPDHDPRARE